MPDQTPDEKAAAEIGCSPSEFTNIMQVWNRNVIVKHILTSRIKERIENKRAILESVNSLDDLKKAQGDIEGMRAAIALINKPEE